MRYFARLSGQLSATGSLNLQRVVSLMATLTFQSTISFVPSIIDVLLSIYSGVRILLRQNLPNQSNEPDPVVTQTLVIDEDYLQLLAHPCIDIVTNFISVTENILEAYTIDSANIQLQTQTYTTVLPQNVAFT